MWKRGPGDKYKARPRREQSDRAGEDSEENKEFICEGQEASRSLTQSGVSREDSGRDFGRGGVGVGARLAIPMATSTLLCPRVELTFPKTVTNDDSYRMQIQKTPPTTRI